ncbi:hypothetical protein QEH59_14170 [Coraliomargarita sp. SDUM461004]|uniref:Type II toxin-antitoxin system RelE/ParE family toxin n=1 Tax=Thalassobacterium sedimentorum TaxID=3041258 RepID=A0ABU1AL94_9BACT|nr:hypothetical protein [Coraliomargarita sp. SDUM461004]MDQ8195575.1 hypothetical protein [Coraliomargarita sp. SDUM461004]
MKIQIRSSALEDLAKGRWFYDSQGLDIGSYFFDSVFSDIDSLSYSKIKEIPAQSAPKELQ